MALKILKLTLNKKWYDMILSGKKKEEYREIKPYWVKRLYDKEEGANCRELLDMCIPNRFNPIKFDAIRFTNGYGKSRPSFLIELKWFNVCDGIEKWGAKGDDLYFTFGLGEIIKES